MPQVDQPGALPMLVDESRVFIDQNNHTWVVVHKTASGGTAQDIATFFANDPAMASTHYVVGQDGAIVQCVLEKDGAGGNCCEKGNFASFLPIGQNLNTWTISIEHVDPASDNSTPLTDAQKAASFRLIRDICQRHNILMRRGDAAGGIIGHCDIDPVDRAHCPGNYPWDELFAYLEGASMLSINDVSVYYDQTSDPQVWRCRQTGQVVGHGILDFYRGLTTPLALLGLPLTGEMAMPGHAGVVFQVFQRGIAVYDAGHVFDSPPGAGPVYLAHLNDPHSPVVAQLLQIIGVPGQIPATVAADIHTAGTALIKALAEAGVTIP